MANERKQQLKGTLVGVKDNKLVLTIDMSAFKAMKLTEEQLSESGNSYRVAGGGSGQYVKLEGEMDGVMVKLDVIVSKKKYDESVQNAKQKESAKAAYAELQQQGVAGKVEEVLGLAGGELAELIALKQLLDAQKAAKAAEGK